GPGPVPFPDPPRRPDQCLLVDELIWDSVGGLLFTAGPEQLLDPGRLVGVAEFLHRPLVEVDRRVPHAADVQGDARLLRPQRRGDVVGYRHAHKRVEGEAVPRLAVPGAGKALLDGAAK